MSYVIIRAISDYSHPACGQMGLFASKNIPPKTRILDYIGEIHLDERPTSDYDFCLHRFQDGRCIGIDASAKGNEARFANDFRGVASKANALFQDHRDNNGELRIAIWSCSKGIKKGEELLVSYGKSWWQTREIECCERLD